MGKGNNKGGKSNKSGAAGGAGGKGKTKGGKGSSAAAGSSEGYPLLVFVCGLPGSGKSTFSRSLQEAFRRVPLSQAAKGQQQALANVDVVCPIVSQDELGSQDTVRTHLVKHLKNSRTKAVILDRCNVTVKERAMWLGFVARHKDLGTQKQRPAVSSVCVFCHTGVDECVERAKAREAHPTLSPEKAEEVIARFSRGLQIPDARTERSFEHIYVVTHPQQVREAAGLVRNGEVNRKFLPLTEISDDFAEDGEENLKEEMPTD